MAKYHIVSHTHWDREWYKTFHHFRVRLVYLIDDMIDILEKDNDFKTFMLDGQTVVLEDYLEVRKHQYGKLKELIEKGRIIIGPWYIQPDEFAPDGESLIRNLLISSHICNEMGVQGMKVGYLPDSFGQTGQMPQILKGFGIDSAVFMRGVPDWKLKKSEFNWEGINGDEVLAVYLQAGYMNAPFLPEEPPRAGKRIQKLIEHLQEYATTDQILVMNGVDHQFVQQQIPAVIEYLNEKEIDSKYIHSTLKEYVDDVRKSHPVLQRLEGELVVPEKFRVHTSIASTRMYQKIRNRQLEIFLEKYVEPVCTISWMNNANYPGDLINHAWKYLIQNQAHDSITGCCTDEVHREMDQRYSNAEEIGKTLLNSNARALGRAMDSQKELIVVHNSSMTLGRQLISAVLYTTNEDFVLKDTKGNIIPIQVEDAEDFDIAPLSFYSTVLGTKEIQKKVTFSFYDDFNFNAGFKVYEIARTVHSEQTDSDKDRIKVHESSLETPFHLIEVCTNGSININCKNTGKTYTGLHVFDDCGDEGDTYNYSPVKNDRIITSALSAASWEIITAGPLKASIAIKMQLEIPLKLTEDKESRSTETVQMHITTTMTVYSDIDRIDFTTEVDNNAYDHRLRVIFDSGIKVAYSNAETQFGVIKRPVAPADENWNKDTWEEKPLPIYSQQRFVDLNDGQVGLAVLNKGLTEYEILDGDSSKIALTLFRGVGMLGRKNLSIRPGRISGIDKPVPDAQCIGLQKFEYALVPHAGDLYQAGIPAAAAQYTAPPLSIQKKLDFDSLFSKVGQQIMDVEIETLTKKIKKRMNRIEAEDCELVTLYHSSLEISALKKAEKDDSLIIRILNSGLEPIENEKIRINCPAAEVLLTNFEEIENGTCLDRIESRMFVLPEVRPFTAITLKVQRIDED